MDDKKIKQLIDYIIKEPVSEAGEKEGHKFPFVSHEILKSGSNVILEHFFPKISQRRDSINSKGSEDEKTAQTSTTGIDSPRSSSSKVLVVDENSYHKENLDYVFSLLNKKEEANCVLLGYFSKVVQSFFQRNKKDICTYFYSQDAHLHNFQHHLYSKSVADLFKNFLVLSPDEVYYNDDNMGSDKNSKPQVYSKFYEKRVKAYTAIYHSLEKSDDADVISNCQFLIESLAAKIDQTVDGMKLLDDVLFKKENLRSLFNCCQNVGLYLNQGKQT
jgi:hypothetical protein